MLSAKVARNRFNIANEKFINQLDRLGDKKVKEAVDENNITSAIIDLREIQFSGGNLVKRAEAIHYYRSLGYQVEILCYDDNLIHLSW